MQIIQYPNTTDELSSSEYRLILVGDIDHNSDWQSELCNRFKGNDQVVVYNPRPPRDIIQSTTSNEILQWCKTTFPLIEIAIVWFPYNADSASVLILLGQLLASPIKLYVGCHPAYPNMKHLIDSVQLLDDRLKIYQSFEEIVDEINTYFDSPRFIAIPVNIYNII